MDVTAGLVGDGRGVAVGIVEVVAGLGALAAVVGGGDKPSGASQGGGGKGSRFVCPVIYQVGLSV